MTNSFHVPTIAVPLVDLLVISCLLTVLWAVYIYIRYRRVVQAFNYLTGPHTLLSKPSLTTFLLPEIPFINTTEIWPWNYKWSIFHRYGQDIISFYTILPEPEGLVCIADPQVIKDIGNNRNNFPKPTELYDAISPFGPNILAAEGDEWKAQRKVVSRSFGEHNNRLVWEETRRAVLELFDYWREQGGGMKIEVPHVLDITREITLMVISFAGFGLKSTWKDSGHLPPHHKMSFKRALGLTWDGLIPYCTLPRWMLGLHPFWREVKTAFQEVDVYMHELIDARTSGPNRENGDDLLSRMISAREIEKDSPYHFTDARLTGNVFTFAHAGHETSSSTLSFALGLLALYPDIQETFRQSILEVVPEGQIPTYDDIPQLRYGIALIYETMRLYPIVIAVPKVSIRDTVFTTTDHQGRSVNVPIPAKTPLSVDIVALHHNSRYWQDPLVFNPERFLGNYNKDAFIPFSVGARSCIGRRFAEVQMLAVLCLMILHYEIEVTEDPKYGAETFEERQARVMKAGMHVITLVAEKIPLTFKRRA